MPTTEATLAREPRRLKGYTLTVEVFDRSADFDATTNALVRVEVGRLRSKLLEYYSTEGRHDELLIELPKVGNAIRVTLRGDARSALAAPGSGPPPATAEAKKPSIAVLPFANLSSDPEQNYFADGVSEDLITDLSKLSGLFVCSRHSSFVYRGASRRIEDIGRELGVRHVLEGSVRRVGARPR